MIFLHVLEVWSALVETTVTDMTLEVFGIRVSALMFN